MTESYREWVNEPKPMSATNALIFSLALTILVIAAIMASNRMNEITCDTEDEIPITINEDSFNYRAGDQLCVHVDKIG